MASIGQLLGRSLAALVPLISLPAFQAAVNPAETLLNRSAQRWQWEEAWLSSSDSAERLAYLHAHRELRVRYFTGDGIRGFCINELGVCDAYAKDSGSGGEFLDTTRFKPRALDASIAQRLADECSQLLEERRALSKAATSMREPTSPATGHSFDAERFPSTGHKAVSVRIDQNWVEVQFHPVAVRKPNAKTVFTLKEAVLREASRMRRNCGDGRVLAPTFTLDDPWVLVYVDLGSPCGEGVMFFSLLADGNWAKQLFDVEPTEVETIRRRIRRMPLFAERIPEKR